MAALLLALVLFASTAYGADDFVRPCITNSDQCVGAELKKYSSCSLNRLNPAGLDPYKANAPSVQIPFFNSTEDRQNVKVVGMGKGYVKEFLCNKAKNEATLTIFVPSLTSEADVIVQYFPPQGKSITFKKKYKATYTGLSMTAKFSSCQKMEIAQSTVTGSVARSVFVKDPQLKEVIKKYPQVATLVQAWDNNPDKLTQSYILARGISFMKLWSSYRLCRYD